MWNTSTLTKEFSLIELAGGRLESDGETVASELGRLLNRRSEGSFSAVLGGNALGYGGESARQRSICVLQFLVAGLVGLLPCVGIPGLGNRGQG